MKRFVFTLIILFLLPVGLVAQRQLEVKGGLDTTSLSIRMGSNNTASARFIIASEMKLNYLSNMEDFVLGETIFRSRKKGIFVDTLYFYPQPNNNVRILRLEAPGYFSQKIGPVKLLSKATYRYRVTDSLPPKRVSMRLYTGAFTFFNSPSIGIEAGFSGVIRLYRGLCIQPSLSYHFLSLYKENSTISTKQRNYMHADLFLRYEVGSRFSIQAGYSQTFFDFCSSGMGSRLEYLLVQRVVLGINAYYFPNYAYVMAGGYIGFVL